MILYRPMDFFIKPLHMYAIKHIFYKHVCKIAKPILFICGNILYLRAMKYLTYNVKSEPISIPVDLTKQYIDKSSLR